MMGDLNIQPHAEREDSFVLLKPLHYRGHTDSWKVPAGYVTDFASVPRLLWWLIPPYGKHAKAAVIHDWLYTEQPNVLQLYKSEYRRVPISRWDADGVFRRIMKESGVPFLRRWTMWIGVRLGGWLSW